MLRERQVPKAQEEIEVIQELKVQQEMMAHTEF